MFFVNTRDKTPIYEQLCQQMRDQIALGVASPGTPLPSVRSLSLELGVNPNTIQRAYRMMEDEGLTYSVPGKGNFVTDNVQELQMEQQESQKKNVKAELEALKKLGVSRQAAIELVEMVYGGEGA